MPWIVLLPLLLVGCAQKSVHLPEGPPVTDDLSTFQAPALYVPPPAPVAPPPPPALQPPAAPEVRYAWRDGDAYPVPVGRNFPTVVRFSPGEVISAVVDGDRASVPEGAATTPAPQAKQPGCFYGPRWRYCKGVAASRAVPVESLAFTATQAGHTQGVVVYTDLRQYYLELRAVRATKTRLVSFSAPLPPPQAPPPQHPGFLPDGAEPRQYHVGYTYTIPHATPDWTPVGVWSDSKVYLQFAPTVLHQRLPVLRGVDHAGKPFVVHSRQYQHWVVVDALPPRLELRAGAGEHAQTVILTRGALRTISCPGSQECPVFP